MARVRAYESTSLLSQVAQALRDRPPALQVVMEEYGPDGEILEAWERPPMALTPEGGTCLVFIHEGAEPKRDWRERGVIPPRGFHRYSDEVVAGR